MRLAPPFAAFAMLFSLLLPLSARAEHVDLGDYVVHYSAVNSTFLKPDIAEAYGIVRGARRAFLNIAVLRKLPDGGTEPVAARVNGGKANLLGQSQDLGFREIRDGEAIYYIGEFDFSNAENLHFLLSIQPEGAAIAHPLRWSTQLYAN